MNPPDDQNEGIAIIGMAGRFPGARNIAEFWQNLIAGAETITQLTDAQLSTAGLDPASARAEPGYVAARGLIERPEWFDAAFFGITPKEAEVMDPQQRVFLEEAWTALEDAGCDPARYAGAIGVFAGTGNNTYFANNLAGRADLIAAVGQITAMVGNEKDYLATRVAYKLDLRGPAISVYTACSTSLVAVCQACTSLLTYQCDTALAGGVSITFPQERGYQWAEGGITSSDGHCRTFDAAATGTVFSSGSGIVVLKRLADALADGDRVYAVIKGSALNNDGAKKLSFTAPSLDGQAEVIALAQALAGFAPETISYIEAHGTGTPVGDPIEIAGLTQAFRAGTDAKNFCAIGSVKTNIGHLDAAAGVAGLIKTALALQHRVLPPSLHFHTPNPKLDLDNTPFRIHTETRAWEPGSTPRRAGVSSFGIGGTNAHVVLEEAPAVPALASHRPSQLIVLSARSLQALEDTTTQLGHFLRRHPDLPIEDVAFTLQEGRRAFVFRRFIVAESSAEAGRWLLRRDRRRVFTTLPTGAPPPSGSAEPLAALGHRWLAGEEIDWTAHAGGGPRCKVSLPTYPFERQRYWAEPRSIAPSQTSADVGTRDAVPTSRAGGSSSRRDTETSNRDECAPQSRGECLLAEVLDELRKCSGMDLRDADPSASFTELGFDSLFLTQAGLALQKRFGVPITFRRLLEDMPTPRDLAAWLDGKIIPEPEPAAHAGPAPESFSGPEFPLTDAQMELLLATQMGPEASASFNESVTIHLRGALDAAALGTAFSQLVARHEAFRTTFAEDGQTQRVAQSLAVGLPLTDLSALGAGAQARAFTDLLATETTPPFDLQRGPLLRAALVKLAEDRHDLVLTMHHIVCDGWSFHRAATDLAALYSARPLAAPRAFRDYARWLHGRQAGPDFAGTEGFWLRQFSDLPPAMELPADHPRGSRRSYRGARCATMVPRELHDSLKRFSATQRCTLFTTMLAAFQVLLHRLTGQDDLVTGIPAAGQAAMDCGDIAGHCVNFLPIRARMAGDPDFISFLGTMRTLLFDAFDHQNLTFGALLQKLALPRDASRMPLLGATFNIDQGGAGLDFAGLGAEMEFNPKLSLGLELSINLVETARGPQLSCGFNRDLFEPETIDRWLAHYLTLLGGIVAGAARPLSRLPMLSEAEGAALLGAGCQATHSFPPERCIHGLFEAHAKAAPDSVALSFEKQRVTYGDLDTRSNQLAHHLRALGVGPEVLVAICLERTPELLVAILAVLKAGGAYVPLDPDSPAERLNLILADAQTPVVLTQEKLLAKIGGTSATVFCFDRDQAALAALGTHTPAPSAGPDSAAYVIYTSGSTGVPKGVVVTHHNVVRLFQATDPWFRFTPGDVWTLFHSPAFDFSVWEIWGALACGGRLVIVPYLVSRSPAQFYALLADEKVTVLNQTPLAFQQLIRVEDDAAARRPLALRSVIFGGEALDFPALRPWFERHGDAQPQLVNMYGITETTVHVTYRPVTLADLDAPGGSRIGKAIPDLDLFVLDSSLAPCPIGIAGELHVGGAGVARGYLRRPELTAGRFIPHPWRAGARLYKSGDLARRTADGDLEYLGRADMQVKVRGYRIELGEIEAALLRHPGVAQCAVLVRPLPSGEGGLAAYWVRAAGAAPTGRELRAFLQERLPSYMLPSAFIALDALPLNLNGKLDPAALPAPTAETDGPAKGEVVAPRNPLEKDISQLWAELLGRNSFSVHDDFFAVGGHSLLAIQLLARLREKFRVDMPVRHLFDAPTIEGVARFIAAELPPPAPARQLRSLITIQRGEPGQRPFFLVPGGWGGEVEFLVYAQIKLHLGADLPIYGLKARGFDGLEEPHRSVREMAVDYVDEIRTVQPHGPYLLGGECIGGVLAYEMARRLEEMGERLDLLVMLDTWRPSQEALRQFSARERNEHWITRWNARVVQPFHEHMEKLSRLTPGEKMRYVWQRATRKRGRQIGEDAEPTALETRKQLTHYPRLLMAHPVGPYSGKLTLLIDETSHRTQGSLGWDDVQTGGLEIHLLPGDHVSYIREHAAAAAAKLREVIDRANHVPA